MTTDSNELIQLNIDLGQAEARGDREWLSLHIAPKLAFRRADAGQSITVQVSSVKLHPAQLDKQG